MLDPDMKAVADEQYKKLMKGNMNYPKYQYSVFLSGRDEQLVIRADNWDEFVELKKKADAVIKAKSEKQEPKKESHLKAKCEDCGAEMIHKNGVGKKGPWEALFCPNAEKGNYNKHKAIFL